MQISDIFPDTWNCTVADVVCFQDSHTDVVNHVRFHPDGKLLSGAEARQGLEEFPAGILHETMLKL